MDMNNNYNYYGQSQVAGQQPYYGAYNPDMYSYPAMGYNNIPVPANQNALTEEEIKILKNTRPVSPITIALDRTDVLKSICTHKDNGRDVVMQLNDGSGMVYCPICHAKWVPDMKNKEEVSELVAQLLDQMQNAKWAGDLPVDLTRELFTLMPLLQKYPEIHEYAMNTFNKYYSARSMYTAADTNLYGMYNSLFTSTPYGAAPQYQPAQGYYGQPQAPQGYVPNGMPANAAVNPMQAPTYGVNPMAPNQQFVNQANMMMGGTVAPAYGAPVAPMYGAPVAPAQTAPAQTAAPASAPTADGTVTTETKIEL